MNDAIWPRPTWTGAELTGQVLLLKPVCHVVPQIKCRSTPAMCTSKLLVQTVAPRALRLKNRSAPQVDGPDR